MDAFALARVARALTAAWGGAVVQRAWEDEAGRVVLRLRRRGETAFLLVSAEPRRHGLGIVQQRPPAPQRPPALAGYLRAHAEGGRLSYCRARPFERIVELGIETAAGETRLLLDAVGPRPLLAALDADGVARAASRWTPRDQPGAHPGRPYEPPPPPEGRMTPSDFLQRFAGAPSPPDPEASLLGLPAWSRGFFPEGEDPLPAILRLARLYEAPLGLRVTPDAATVDPEAPESPDGEVLAAAGAWLLGEGHDAPGVAPDTAPGVAPDTAPGVSPPAPSRQQAKLRRRIANIRTDLEHSPDPDALRRQAALLSSGAALARRGDESVTLTDPATGEEVRVALDPRLSPGENVNRLHERAKKAVRARRIAAERLAQAEAELAAPTPTPQAPPAAAAPARREAPARFRRFRSSDGWTILVGRNRVENDLLLKEGKPWDLWLHARDGAGAHVLLVKPGREAKPSDRTLEEAAGLAATYSSRSAEGAVEVMLAELSRVKKPKGAGPGRVTVAGERTLLARPGAGKPEPR